MPIRCLSTELANLSCLPPLDRRATLQTNLKALRWRRTRFCSFLSAFIALPGKMEDSYLAQGACYRFSLCLDLISEHKFCRIAQAWLMSFHSLLSFLEQALMRTCQKKKVFLLQWLMKCNQQGRLVTVQLIESSTATDGKYYGRTCYWECCVDKVLVAPGLSAFFDWDLKAEDMSNTTGWGREMHCQYLYHNLNC